MACRQAAQGNAVVRTADIRTRAMSAENPKTLSIVVPVYYNAGSLGSLYDALCDVESSLATRGLALELIFVDDGSGDTSLLELLEIKRKRPTTRVVKLTRNFGSVSAIRTGLRFVSGDCFAFLAADLQDPPALIIEMADRWLAGTKFVICERSTRDDSASSRFISKIYYAILRRLVLADYPSGGYDLALMDKAMLPYLAQSAKTAFLPLLAYWLGFKPEIIYYHRQPRLHGKSRWTFRKKLKAFFDVMLGFSATPIRLISAIGALVSLVSIGYGVVVVVATITGDTPVPGFPTVVALITFLLGLIIMMLGVIGEYLWRIFDETNRRPEAVVEEIF
jgi:glycosyltransferase involved in cell wall biosynthesis